MFADADLDINKRGKSDEVIGNLLELSGHGFFEDNYDLLASIFNDKAILKNDHLEMSKADFVGVLKESDILIKPKPVKQEDAK